jgi:pimeloyl-ACP methyl ester carboxylesterase
LLCFHQVPNSSQIYTEFLSMVATDRLAIAFDTPGYGMSDPATDPQTIGAYADAIEDGVAALGLAGAVDLLGYHTGAAIAAELAARGRLAVRRVMLVAVPVFTETERASFGALPPIPFDEEGDWAREEWRRSWRWRGPGQLRASVLRTFAEKMRPGARERGARAIAAYDMAKALSRIRQPLMIVRPKDDLWDATARARTLRRDTAYSELPELGHGMWEVAPGRMAALVRRFLDA